MRRALAQQEDRPGAEQDDGAAQDEHGSPSPAAGEDAAGRHTRAMRRCSERGGELGRRGEAVIWEWGEGPGDGVLHGARDVGPGSLHCRRRLQCRPVVHPAFRHARRRRLPRQHFEQHAAEAVNVGAGIEIPQRHRLLRAHIAGRADRLARLGERQAARGADRARDAEVGNDRVVAREEDVLRLDVAVNDALGVGERERVGGVARDLECRFERQPSLPQQPMSERLSLDVGHDVVEQPVDFAGREDRDDVRMAEVRREVHLSNEPLPQETGGYLGIQHFDRHPAMRMLLHRQEHPGHATGADLALDVVAGSETLAQGVEHVEHLPKLVVGGRPSEWRVRLLADFRRRATIAG